MRAHVRASIKVRSLDRSRFLASLTVRSMRAHTQNQLTNLLDPHSVADRFDPTEATTSIAVCVYTHTFKRLRLDVALA